MSFDRFDSSATLQDFPKKNLNNLLDISLSIPGNVLWRLSQRICGQIHKGILGLISGIILKSAFRANKKHCWNLGAILNKISVGISKVISGNNAGWILENVLI